MKIWISGTVALDIILDYSGRFREHIDPKKVHVISLSFLVNGVKKSLGGTAANIAYNLNLLGVQCGIIGAVGRDGRDLAKRYRSLGIDISHLQISKKWGTATGYIMTDRDDNQIAAFYPGAMREAAGRPRVARRDLAIIAAEDPTNMTALARHYQKNKLSYIFDPGQAITALAKKQLLICLKGASIVIGNDYEIAGISRMSTKFLISKSVVIRTLGPRGSQIMFSNKRKINIGSVKVKRAVDPTGAGDAYRAGLVKGIVEGLDIKRAAQLGATAAAFAVEQYGTQNHKFNYDILVMRHNRNFLSKI